MRRIKGRSFSGWMSNVTGLTLGCVAVLTEGLMIIRPYGLFLEECPHMKLRIVAPPLTLRVGEDINRNCCRPVGRTETLTAPRWQLQFIRRNHLFSLGATVRSLFVTQGFAAEVFPAGPGGRLPGVVNSAVLLSLPPTASEPRSAARACVRVEAAVESGRVSLGSTSCLHVVHVGNGGEEPAGEITEAV